MAAEKKPTAGQSRPVNKKYIVVSSVAGGPICGPCSKRDAEVLAKIRPDSRHLTITEA